MRCESWPAATRPGPRSGRGCPRSCTVPRPAGRRGGRPENETRFAWLARPRCADGSDRPPDAGVMEDVGRVLGPARRAGKLVSVLQEFASRGVNLSRIESRPQQAGARPLHLLRRPRGPRSERDRGSTGGIVASAETCGSGCYPAAAQGVALDRPATLSRSLWTSVDGPVQLNRPQEEAAVAAGPSRSAGRRAGVTHPGDHSRARPRVRARSGPERLLSAAQRLHGPQGGGPDPEGEGGVDRATANAAAIGELHVPATSRDPAGHLRAGPAGQRTASHNQARGVRPRLLDLPVLRDHLAPDRGSRDPAQPWRAQRAGTTSSRRVPRATAARATAHRSRPDEAAQEARAPGPTVFIRVAAPVVPTPGSRTCCRPERCRLSLEPLS